MRHVEPLSSIQRLAAVPYPAAGEHPASYVRRLAVANGQSSLSGLAHLLDLPADKILSSARSWDAVRKGVDLPDERIALLETGVLGFNRRHTIRVDGHDLAPDQFDFRLLRSCPLCLVADDFLPKRFGIRMSTACIRHGVRLTDGCPCGAERLANGPGDPWSCSSCGTPYRNLPVEPADPRELIIASLLLGAAAGSVGGLPPDLVDETLRAKAAVIDRLGNVAILERIENESGRRARSWNPLSGSRRRNISDDREAVIAAADLLTNWPERYHRTLARLVSAGPGLPRDSTVLGRRFPTPAGRHAMHPFIDRTGREIPFGEEARMAFLRDHLGYVPGQRTMLVDSKVYGSMGLTPIATVDGPLEIRAFVPVSEFGARMHVGADRHLAASFEAGLIDVVQHVDGQVLVRRADFEAMLSKLKALPEGEGRPADYVPALVASGRRGPFYRQREFYRDVVNGMIRSRDAGPETEGMGSRLVNLADFERRRLLCKTAIHLVNDEFTERFRFVERLWGRRMPSKDMLRTLAEAGGIARRTREQVEVFSIRDVLHLIQRESKVLFVTDPAVLHPLTPAAWQSVLVDDVPASGDVVTPATAERDLGRAEAERRAEILERFIQLDRRDDATKAQFAAELGLTVNSLLTMSTDWRRHRDVRLLQGDAPKITADDRAAALAALQDEINMDGVFPTRLAETVRRLDVLRRFLELNAPTMDDRRQAAAEMGVNEANFMKIVRRWILHRSALVIPGATFMKRRRHN